MNDQVFNWVFALQFDRFKNVSFGDICFVHPIFRFWFLVTFGDEITKIQKHYIIFVYILQGKMDKTEKNGKKTTQLKWPKYQKPKDENMGWTKQYLCVGFTGSQNQFTNLVFNKSVVICFFYNFLKSVLDSCNWLSNSI